MLKRRTPVAEAAPLICPNCGEATNRLEEIPAWSGMRAVGCPACLADAVEGVRLLRTHERRFLAW